jgi:transcriptional regulator GlxA family with amidase domain
LQNDLNIETLAEKVAMSPRNFSRIFTNEFGMTAAQFVERLRVDTARRLLVESDQSLEQVAERVGFGSVDTMNRAFRRQARELPSTLRAGALGKPA